MIVDDYHDWQNLHQQTQSGDAFHDADDVDVDEYWHKALKTSYHQQHSKWKERGLHLQELIIFLAYLTKLVHTTVVYNVKIMVFDNWHLTFWGDKNIFGIFAKIGAHQTGM